VEVPDRVIAQLLVVRAQPETAVALVTHTEEELELGDHFRGAGE
jgi:L-lysine 2,3-aminomutase